MIKQQRLSDLIQQRIFTTPTSTGWNICCCPLCNDYKKRGGFKYEEDTIIYSCFNCSTRCVYEEFSGSISKKFRKVLNAFGLDDSEISSVVNTAFFFKKKESSIITLSSLTKISTVTPTIQLPPKSFPIGHPEFLEYQESLVSYLIKRKINIEKYQFFFSLDDRFINSVIIPFYRNGNLIYWQARNVTDSAKRYDNAPVSREAVMFNMDQLHKYVKTPLFVFEGAFDAMLVDGVAILSSKLSDAKIELLSKTHRRLIFVIDKDKTGKLLAEKVLSLGWEIAFSPDGTADLNDSAQKFNLSYSIYKMMGSIVSNPDLARLSINLNCR